MAAVVSSCLKLSLSLCLTMQPSADCLHLASVINRHELLESRHSTSRSRTPLRHTSESNAIAATDVHSLLKVSRHSTMMRKVRAMRRYEAKQRDNDKIAELEAKLGTGPKYIVVEKIVEVPQIQTAEGENDPNLCAKDMRTCEAGTQSDDIEEQYWSSSAQTMYTEAKVIAYAQALKAEVEAEYEAKLQELQSLSRGWMTILPSCTPRNLTTGLTALVVTKLMNFK